MPEGFSLARLGTFQRDQRHDANQESATPFQKNRPFGDVAAPVDLGQLVAFGRVE